MLHLFIEVGNALLESFLDWIEERVETITPPEIVMRNEVILLKYIIIGYIMSTIDG